MVKVIVNLGEFKKWEQYLSQRVVGKIKLADLYEVLRTIAGK